MRLLETPPFCWDTVPKGHFWTEAEANFSKTYKKNI